MPRVRGGVYIVCNSKSMWYYILNVRVTVVHLNIDENEDFGVEISQDLVKYWKVFCFNMFIYSENRNVDGVYVWFFNNN